MGKAGKGTGSFGKCRLFSGALHNSISCDLQVEYLAFMLLRR